MAGVGYLIINMTTPKGFTLIELLIVIGIIALLATVIVIVLNPAQLLGQARDSQRISDLDTLRSALALYLATASGNPPITLGDPTKCYVSVSDTVTLDPNCGGRHDVSRTTTYATTSSARAVNGSGWVPVDLQQVSGGSPFSVLPVDPANNVDFFYSYAADDGEKTFELNANMESERYQASVVGGDDVESDTEDGGNRNEIYEVGTNLNL